ncbi:hypothetical protein AZE42_05852 [Rhizopogon vesiculosus]|uniref:Uncharacterized protein n=1 Tax=Rhizopogon vesiculosus TaxID=180088 RepID=A0A1J8PJS7_9AGAM|nr:hypothetical protein AZE42_05852 [Rhizopogon vesiculosus]
MPSYVAQLSTLNGAVDQ